MYLLWDLLKMGFAILLFVGGLAGYVAGAAWIAFHFGIIWAVVALAVGGPILYALFAIAWDISEDVDL